MVLGRVEGGEVIVIGLYFRTFKNLKAHACKYRDKLVYYKRVGVVCALFAHLSGQGDVNFFALVARAHLAFLNKFFHLVETGVGPFAQGVYNFTQFGALFGRNFLKLFHKGGNIAALAKEFHLNLAQGSARLNVLHGLVYRRFDVVDFVHIVFLHKSFSCKKILKKPRALSSGR